MLRCLLILCSLALLSYPRLLAHEMTIECSAADGAIRIAAELEGEPTPDATIEIRAATGEVRLENQLNETGEFLWKPDAVEDVTIAVNAGLGHRETIELSSAAIARMQQDGGGAVRSDPTFHHEDEVADGRSPASEAALRSHRGSPDVATRGLTGIALLLGAGGLWLSILNARRLRRIEERSGGGLRADASRD